MLANIEQYVGKENKKPFVLWSFFQEAYQNIQDPDFEYAQLIPVSENKLSSDVTNDNFYKEFKQKISDYKA